MARQRRVRHRYSVDKARRLVKYLHLTSTWRHLAIVTAFPLPALVASLLPVFVPLQDPTLGALHNPQVLLHGGLTTLATFFGGMLQARAVTTISHSDITTLEVLAIAGIGSSIYWLIMSLVAVCWRFPIPFTMVLGAAPYNLSMVGAAVVVLRRHMARPSQVRTRLAFYMPSHFLQVFQIFFYPTYSTLFDGATQNQQMLLIVLFPICKHVLKHTVTVVSYHLGDFASEVGVAGVEICAAIYQATIMQTVPSYVSGALIIGVDVLQSCFNVQRCLALDARIIARGAQWLEDETKSMAETQLDKFANKHDNAWKTIATNGIRATTSPFHGSSVVPGSPAPTEDVLQRSRSNAGDQDVRAITQTLEIFQSIETIVLIEYLEVVAPLVNTACLLVAAQLPSAIYNPNVRPFYGHTSDLLMSAVASVFVYSVLQGATLVAMCLVVRGRCHVSALGLLAFVLETHVWSLQGKMLAWFTFMFGFSVVHYGVDFSFHFDFAARPRH